MTMIAKQSRLRRPMKSVLPPDATNPHHLPAVPVILRNAKLRLAAGDPVKYQRKAWKTKHRPETWKTLEITIPKEVAEVAGLEEGMTMVCEGYAGGTIRMFPAGDCMSRDEEII
jgi:hypothetical protein